MPAGSVDLAYLDPPFQTGRVHRLSTRDGSTWYEFDDVWDSPRAYAEFLRERLEEVRRVLSETGSIFFHCGRDAGHVARGLLDRTFGPSRFRSEIIWHYRRWSNGSRALLPAQQTIHYYAKSDSCVFNPIWEGYSPATNVDQLLQRRRRDGSKKSVYDRDAEGRPVPSGPKRGVPLGDVWDVPYLNPKAREGRAIPPRSRSRSWNGSWRWPARRVAWSSTPSAAAGPRWWRPSPWGAGRSVSTDPRRRSRWPVRGWKVR